MTSFQHLLQHLLARALTALVLFGLAGHSLHAESWPVRPISLFVGASPGGSMDAIARTFAEFVSKKLGQPIVVENRSGGGGVVSAIAVAKASPAFNYPQFLHPRVHPTQYR
jgi:tripartite-type tricarboxylate transporter receptor subunit TctC